MSARRQALLDALRDATLASPGALEPAEREAIARGGGPDDLAPYLAKVHAHAYTVVDRDVDELRAAGRSEDALFEATLAAAVGEGLRRWETVQRVLGGRR